MFFALLVLVAFDKLTTTAFGRTQNMFAKYSDKNKYLANHVKKPHVNRSMSIYQNQQIANFLSKLSKESTKYFIF
jgi:hypothetical protein